MDDEKLIGPKEIADTWSLPLSWVYAKAEAGMLPSLKIGRYRRFCPSEIRAWLEAQRQAPAGR